MKNSYIIFKTFADIDILFYLLYIFTIRVTDLFAKFF